MSQIRPLDLGVYIHVPFCQSRCTYCDFNTYVGLGHLIDDYVKSVCREIRAWPESHGAPAPSAAASGCPSRVVTVYFGGGTPSLLSTAHMTALLAACHQRFPAANAPCRDVPAERLDNDMEITLEANPETMPAQRLRDLRSLGINRLSLGVQSFDDAMLRLLGRSHTADQARDTYHAARQAGFDNISLDFIYGLPGQSLAHWRDILAQAVVLQPDHLSLYALTLEDDVPLARDIAAGRCALPDDDTVADMYALAEDMLHDAGYVHYEISNWAACHAASGSYRAARHNLIYWRRQPYLGFGAGAHSFDGQRRYHNALHPADYIARMDAHGTAVAESEIITSAMAVAETMFLGLRLLHEGVMFEEAAARYGQPVHLYQAQINDLIAQGLLERHEGRLLLTGRGHFLSDEVFMRFMP